MSLIGEGEEDLNGRRAVLKKVLKGYGMVPSYRDVACIVETRRRGCSMKIDAIRRSPGCGTLSRNPAEDGRPDRKFAQQNRIGYESRL